MELDDDGSTCIGWEGKMFRVGGLIPDVEFISAYTQKHAPNSAALNISNLTNLILISLCIIWNEKWEK